MADPRVKDTVTLEEAKRVIEAAEKKASSRDRRTEMPLRRATSTLPPTAYQLRPTVVKRSTAQVPPSNTQAAPIRNSE